MFLRLCQLKTLLLVLLILNSCTFRRQKTSLEGVNPTAKWFRINAEHALEDTSGIKEHLFFDAASKINWNKKTVKFVAMTPQNSKLSHALDLASGRPYVTHMYCKQDDIWGLYSGTVNRPPYTQGFIPRVLDQLGKPQKIIYFSKKHSLTPFQQYEAKVIAGYVESFCPVMSCEKDEWHSRLVLIGVDKEDDELHDLTVEQFKESFNWPKVRAHLENAEGQNFTGDHTSPRWRAGEPIAIKDTMDFFKKRAKFFTGRELLGIQKSCHDLFDKLWTHVGEERLEDRSAKNAEEVKQKLDVINILRSGKEPVGFMERFQAFSQEHYTDLVTCSKFIYSGNINQNAEKFWFLNYIKAFYLLYQQGYYYHCGSNSWGRNILTENGQYLYTVVDTLKECKINQIDSAMNYMKNFIRAEKDKTSEFLRFIDYDNQGIGTYEKIYNWVHFPHAKMGCSSDQHEMFLKNIDVFMDDINWKKRTQSKDYDDKVIY